MSKLSWIFVCGGAALGLFYSDQIDTFFSSVISRFEEVTSAPTDSSQVKYEYSVRVAFCRDYAKNRASIYSSTLRYDMQVAFNSCMRNADNLINDHEREKDRQIERQRQHQLENERRRQAEAAQRDRERRRKAEIEQKKWDNIDDLFR